LGGQGSATHYLDCKFIFIQHFNDFRRIFPLMTRTEGKKKKLEGSRSWKGKEYNI